MSEPCCYRMGVTKEFASLFTELIFRSNPSVKSKMKREAHKQWTCAKPGKHKRKRDGKWFCGLHRTAAKP